MHTIAIYFDKANRVYVFWEIKRCRLKKKFQTAFVYHAYDDALF